MKRNNKSSIFLVVLFSFFTTLFSNKPVTDASDDNRLRKVAHEDLLYAHQ